LEIRAPSEKSQSGNRLPHSKRKENVMSKPPRPNRRSFAICIAVVIHGFPPEQFAAEFGIQTKSVLAICSRVRRWLHQQPECQELIREFQQHSAVVDSWFSGELPHEWN